MDIANKCQVTVAEAAELLGLEADEVRQRIRAGELQAERVLSPQGYTYLVTLPDGIDGVAPAEPPPPRRVSHRSSRLFRRNPQLEVSEEPPPEPPADAASLPQSADGALFQALDLVTSRDQRIEDNARRIRDLEETQVKLTEQISAYQAQLDAMQVRLDQIEARDNEAAAEESSRRSRGSPGPLSRLLGKR